MEPGCCRGHTWIEQSCLLYGSPGSDLQSGQKTVHASVCTVSSLCEEGMCRGSSCTFELGLQSTLCLLSISQTYLSVHSQTPGGLMRNVVDQGTGGDAQGTELLLLPSAFAISVSSSIFVLHLIAFCLLLAKALVTRTTRLSKQR